MEDKELNTDSRFIDADGNTTVTNPRTWTEFAYSGDNVREWNKNIEDDTQHLNMTSLYDYFGGAVGQVIGKETYKESVKQGVRSFKKAVGAGQYPEYGQGVRVYPKAWLEMFFGNLDLALKLLEKKVKIK